MNEHIVIITGASPLADHVVESVPHDAIVLAVDGGIDHALAAGLQPSGLIGDLDSVTPEGLAWAREHATIARHPADKDETDTELALAFAADMDPAHLTLMGGGDRLDHSVAGLGALGSGVLTSIPRIDAWWDGQHLDIIHGPGKATLRLVPGSILSAIALHGPCTKVSLSGVRWPLTEATLESVVGLGVSNEVLDADTGDGGAATVEVSVSTGVLTIFDVPAPHPPTEDQT